jgi:hypothetical protein
VAIKDFIKVKDILDILYHLSKKQEHEILTFCQRLGNWNGNQRYGNRANCGRTESRH